MANIINNNFYQFQLKINKDEYWDMTLNKDASQYIVSSYDNIDDLVITYFDASCIQNNNVICYPNYIWDKAFSSNHVLENIGYTGFDNGLLYFERDKIDNKYFFNIYQNSKYDIIDDLHLKLHFITGCTNQYSYEYKKENDLIKLNGGFLQGFFKTQCDKYSILPSNFTDGDVITYEFMLNKMDFEKPHKKTLNDLHPDNKGIFFYLGTRSENKWIYFYDKIYKNNTLSYDDYIEDSEIDLNKHKISSFVDMTINEIEECSYFDEITNDGFESLECDNEYIETDLDISDFEYTLENDSLTIGKYEEYMDYNNPFLLYNRTCDGFNAKNNDKEAFIRYVGLRNKFRENLFLLMNRTCSGYTISSIEDKKEEYDVKYNLYADLWNNALAFRITDDGEIGYRYLVQDCDKQFKIEESYSKENIIKNNEWNHIIVKIVFAHDYMILRFYVNGNLVFISKALPKLNLRELNELYEKQETVPYNISIGGGTQGLLETILPNYMIDIEEPYPLEKYFGGSFIGYLKYFKIYYGEIDFLKISNIFHDKLK